MGQRRKKRPEFELPAILIETISNYLGPTETNKLTSAQAQALMAAASSCAYRVGQIISLEHPLDFLGDEEQEPNGDDTPSGAEDVHARPA